MNKEPIFKPTFGEYISNREALENEIAFLQTQGDPETAVRSQFYGSDILQEMLNRKSVVGIRFSFGLNENNVPNLILAPLDTYGNVIETEGDGGGLGGGNESKGGNGPTCPTVCE
ncbi:hypothetical protein [uncultured Arcticibacterium sp.]|uniref:hypothetical protein n=1 Tax=uncultured Arcticibacterium sp. TaxID=2173042 RepID=UPI0030FC67E4